METATRSETSIRFGEFALNLHTRELYRGGSRLKIRGHPIDVLEVLVEHPGELVTRETLRKQLWPDDTFVDFEQILNNSVGKLRSALGDEAEKPKFIETLPRLGYRFIAPVEKSEINNHAAQIPPIADAQPAAPSATISSKSHRISKHWIIWRLVALGVFAFAAFSYWYVHIPLPSPRITHYEQLTLDGRRKIPLGTDGARIYVLVMKAQASIAQVPVSGGKVTEIPIDLDPPSDLALSSVSPDGSSLLVMNHLVSGEGFTVWVVGTLGHPVRYLTKAQRAAWSPSGTTVVYTDPHGDIYAISANGGAPRLLHREDAPANQITRTRDMAWSPDGGTIRLTRWGGKIFEMSSTGANFHEWLPGWNGSAQKCCGQWTPDGQFFLFVSGRELTKGPTFRPLAQIWAVDERRGSMRPRIAEPILLASDPLLWGDPVPSRDGKKIFARGVSLRGELARYDPTSKHLEPYLGGISAELLDFSRDGKYVAYVTFPGGILWRANRDGAGLVQLTEPPFYPRNPRWSPDGTKLLFTDNTENGVDTIYVISSQGGTPKRLCPGDAGVQSLADWSPDGTKVVYSTAPVFSFVPQWDGKRVETHIVEIASGKVTILPKGPGGFWAPLWSPDGRYIAGQWQAKGLVVFDLETKEWRVLPLKGDVAFHNWSHDGRFLYFLFWIKGKVGVYRLAVQGGKEELVADLPEDFQTLQSTGYYGMWFGLDPTDAPLTLRNVGTDEIYALTLERK